LAGGVSPAATGGAGVSTTAEAGIAASTEETGRAWIVVAAVLATTLAVAVFVAGVRRRSARVRRRPVAG
jgi:hypothetical protein